MKDVKSCDEVLDGLGKLIMACLEKGWTNSAGLAADAVKWIEGQSRPLTLDECRAILNENQYLFGVRTDGRGEWVENATDPGVLFNGFDAMNLWEATAIARAFLVEGGAA